MRLIDADDFKRFIERLTELGAPYDEIIKLLDQQPTVEIPSFNLLQDGTLIIDTDLYPKVGRVFVEHEGLGTFYYSYGYERPKGKWIPGKHECPCCGESKFKDLDADIWADWCPKYCPNCGTEMEIGE